MVTPNARTKPFFQKASEANYFSVLHGSPQDKSLAGTKVSIISETIGLFLYKAALPHVKFYEQGGGDEELGIDSITISS